MNKTRKQKRKEYEQQYGHIPIDYEERLKYMIQQYNLSEKQMKEILQKRDNLLRNLFFFECKVVQLLEEPEGASRPKYTILTKSNFNREAINNSNIHVYVPRAAEDNRFMKELCEESELLTLDSLINTPCVIRYDLYLKTPSSYNVTDIFLSEIGLIRPPIDKPDWDNSGKKYCDMYNENVWLDDALVYDGNVVKYYSILPRVEIYLQYLNAVYNKQQYNRIISRKNYDGGELHYFDRYGRFV